MKKTILCIALIGFVALSGQAVAELCTVDAVPAATLLVPNFQVDLDSSEGVTTLFSVNNASAAPQVAHVTVWSNWSVPVFDFDIYLTGYDVQTLNMRDVLNGLIPQTGPGSGNSNVGFFSDPHAAQADYPSCNFTSSPGGGPYYNSPAFGEAFKGHVQDVLRGLPSPLSTFGGACFGAPSATATGYITIDLVNDCSLLFPSDHSAASPYFGTSGIAADENVLWGDYFVVDPGNDFASGDNLVHIEADAGFESGASASGITFYGRYLDIADPVGLDHREPLGTTYATRHTVGGAFSGGTDLVIWRSSETDDASPITCGGIPAWAPLNQTETILFDEQENPVIITEDDCISGDPTCEIEIGILAPIETQVKTVGEDPLFIPSEAFNFGWIYMNLNTGDTGVYGGYNQAWVSTNMSADGRYQVGYPAVQLDNACDPNDFIINVVP